VTSPPYWGLRDYHTRTWTGGHPGCRHTRTCTITRTDGGPPTTTCQRCGATVEDRQYGHEPTPDAYIATLRRVFTALARVLTPTGTVWLNLGDSYSTARPGRTTDPLRTSTLAGRDAAAVRRESVRAAGVDRIGALPAKNLHGMPWRVAFALQADGWILRNAIIWHKPNAMPESVRDRLSTRYELLFLLVRQPRYYFDLDAIREPLARPEALAEGIVIGGARKGRHGGIDATRRRRGASVYGTGKYQQLAAFPGDPPGAAMRPTGRQHTAAHPAGRNPGDVWSISTRPLRQAHYAAYPVDLPLRCIAAGCRPGGAVLDPFSGAGTTGLAARQLGRTYLGIDLNPAFHDIGLTRLGLRPADAATERRAA
ncbi:DNA-methyltransferase, partial [Protofrankia coriariae]|uniref:DNA-methyltransferase n=1 Tax=Protofrankia coriariae TaxID=1562887 RepID=UPI000A325E12